MQYVAIQTKTQLTNFLAFPLPLPLPPVRFHMHSCFKLSNAILGSGTGAGGLDDLGWWQGKALLAGMTLLLQKLPVSVLGLFFQLERKRRRAEAMELKPYKACGLCKIPRIFAVVRWVVFFLYVVACFGTTIILTSTGFLQTWGTGDGGTADGLVEGTGAITTHCGCAGITDGKDVESDWITLLMMVVLFRTLVYVRRATKKTERIE